MILRPEDDPVLVDLDSAGGLYDLEALVADADARAERGQAAADFMTRFYDNWLEQTTSDPFVLFEG